VVGLKDEKIILRIPRDAVNELMVKTGNFWNIDIVDIRWHKNSSPTSKGVRMNMDELVDVYKALDKIMKMRNNNENDSVQQDV
jgi:hypothetical protein